MFRAILTNDVQRLFKLGERLLTHHRDSATALLCLDHGFTTLPTTLDSAGLPGVADFLARFLVYVKLLRDFASDSQLCDHEGIRRLFAIHVASQDFLLLPRATILHDLCSREQIRGVRMNDQGALIPKAELNQLLQHVLQERLRKKVYDENELCYYTRTFQVCLPFFTSGRCGRQDQCPREHLPAEGNTVESYNLRVRIHLQQILIYHCAHAVAYRGEQTRQHR